MTEQPAKKIEVDLKAISDIVHSINNSLFIASGKIEMLLEESSDDQLKKELNTVYSHLEKIKELVEQLRGLYRN